MIQPVSISQLTRQIKSIIEHEFSYVYLTGEISNFKHHTSGHFYFTLKDDKAQINANMWSSRNADLIFTPENGMKVLVKGRLTLYESKGSYQVDVYEMRPSGMGDLQIAFEKLKQKLFEEGLFDKERKKEIPDFPERVGIITSQTGAALQDFLSVTAKRYPVVKLLLFNAGVQGAGASGSIVRAIRTANNQKFKLDVLVLARGGGSIEDLWCFNEEKVAREIFNSRVPVVSAIGHEIDFTISDFVSDLRAPTPSAAAEIIFPDKSELVKKINQNSFDLVNIVNAKIISLKKILDTSSSNYYFRRVIDSVNEYKFRLDELEKSIGSEISEKLINVKKILDSNEKLLNSMGPEQTLKRGYSIVFKNNKVISTKNKLKRYDNIDIKFCDGESKAVIVIN